MNTMARQVHVLPSGLPERNDNSLDIRLLRLRALFDTIAFSLQRAADAVISTASLSFFLSHLRTLSLLQSIHHRRSRGIDSRIASRADRESRPTRGGIVRTVWSTACFTTVCLEIDGSAPFFF